MRDLRRGPRCRFLSHPWRDLSSPKLWPSASDRRSRGRPGRRWARDACLANRARRAAPTPDRGLAKCRRSARWHVWPAGWAAWAAYAPRNGGSARRWLTAPRWWVRTWSGFHSLEDRETRRRRRWRAEPGWFWVLD